MSQVVSNADLLDKHCSSLRQELQRAQFAYLKGWRSSMWNVKYILPLNLIWSHPPSPLDPKVNDYVISNTPERFAEIEQQPQIVWVN